MKAAAPRNCSLSPRKKNPSPKHCVWHGFHYWKHLLCGHVVFFLYPAYIAPAWRCNHWLYTFVNKFTMPQSQLTECQCCITVGLLAATSPGNAIGWIVHVVIFEFLTFSGKTRPHRQGAKNDSVLDETCRIRVTRVTETVYAV